jgi:uncharacterized protein (UPF0335 family)
MSGPGDNSINSGELQAFISRIERLEEEKRAIADDVKEVYQELKGSGYDARIVRKIIARRRMDESKRQEEEALIELYEEALGPLKGTPLGRAAVVRGFGGLP